MLSFIFKAFGVISKVLSTLQIIDKTFETYEKVRTAQGNLTKVEKKLFEVKDLIDTELEGLDENVEKEVKTQLSSAHKKLLKAATNHEKELEQASVFIDAVKNTIEIALTDSWNKG